METPLTLTLALPTIVTNPAGITTNITWAALTLPAWLSLSGGSLIINSSDVALAGTSHSITITATDTISGLRVS